MTEIFEDYIKENLCSGSLHVIALYCPKMKSAEFRQLARLFEAEKTPSNVQDLGLRERFEEALWHATEQGDDFDHYLDKETDTMWVYRKLL